MGYDLMQISCSRTIEMIQRREMGLIKCLIVSIFVDIGIIQCTF